MKFVLTMDDFPVMRNMCYILYKFKITEHDWQPAISGWQVGVFPRKCNRILEKAMMQVAKEHNEN